MTQRQSQEWFGTNVPSVKQAKRKGLKYWKKFAADPNKKRIYYNTDSSTDEDERNKRKTKPVSLVIL